jgi:hypothetical protein
MELLPVDLTSLVAAIMGILIVLIPVAGLTARFALKPTVEAFSRFFEGKAHDESVLMLERRCALLESQLELVETQLRRLEEGREFDRKLKASSQASTTGSGGTGRE